MRTAIYQHLTKNCKSVTVWYQPYTADGKTPKPYGVISFGERVKNSFNRRSAFQDVRIWIYVDPLNSSYLALDAAVAEVKALLSDQLLTKKDGGRFLIEVVQDGRDFYDDDLKALAKYIDFTIPLGG